jgi:hypothetical protein
MGFKPPLILFGFLSPEKGEHSIFLREVILAKGNS